MQVDLSPKWSPLESSFRSKAFFYLESTGKKHPEKYVAIVFLSICVFCRLDENGVISLKYRYKTGSVAKIAPNFCVVHVKHVKFTD